MGIRIHKQIGYGVSDIKTKRRKYGRESADPRVNFKAYDEMIEQAYDMDFDQFISWAEANENGIMSFYADVAPTRGDLGDEWKFTIAMLKSAQKNGGVERNWDFGSCIVYDNEYGMANVILVIPPSYTKHWSRYDDIIDYCEEGMRNGMKGSINWAKPLNSAGIYPYDGWVRFRPSPPGIWKDKEAEDKHAFMAPAMYSQMVGRWSKKAAPLAKGILLDHLKNDYRPVMPIEAHMVVWFYREMFANPVEFMNSLRPMMYVHWG